MRLRDRKMSVRLANILTNSDIYTDSDALWTLRRWLIGIDKPRNFGARSLAELCALLNVRVRVIPGSLLPRMPRQYVIESLGAKQKL